MEQPLQSRQQLQPARRRRRKQRHHCKRHRQEGSPSPTCRGHKDTHVPSNSPPQVRALPSLKPILDFLNVKGDVFTKIQIMAHLTEYIKQKSLYDPANPHRVYCKNDTLGEIFGCSEFSTANACQMLLQNLETLHPTANHADPVPSSDPSCTYGSNRTTSLSTNDSSFCSDSDQQSFMSSCLQSTLSGVLGESVNRKRNNDTAFPEVRNSVCTVPQDPVSSTPSTSCASDSLRPHNRETVDTEYLSFYKRMCDNATDVVTDMSDDLFFLEVDNSGIESSDTHIDEGEVGGDELGNSDSSDSNIEEEDAWQCDWCSGLNHRMTRQCRKCLSVQADWYPATVARDAPDIGYSRLKCALCRENPSNGCIVHGQTGHQVCCVKCAKKLKEDAKLCPVCRRKIEKVIKNLT